MYSGTRRGEEMENNRGVEEKRRKRRGVLLVGWRLRVADSMTSSYEREARGSFWGLA